MSKASDQPSLAVRLRNFQAFTVAVVLPPLVFLVIALAVRARGTVDFLGWRLQLEPPPDTPTISYIAIGFALLAIFAHLTFPDRMAATWRLLIARGTWVGRFWMPPLSTPINDTERLWALFEKRLILTLGPLELAALFLLIAYLIEENTLALVTSILFILGMALQFPTRSRVDRWVEEQQQ